MILKATEVAGKCRKANAETDRLNMDKKALNVKSTTLLKLYLLIMLSSVLIQPSAIFGYENILVCSLC